MGGRQQRRRKRQAREDNTKKSDDKAGDKTADSHSWTAVDMHQQLASSSTTSQQKSIAVHEDKREHVNVERRECHQMTASTS